MPGRPAPRARRRPRGIALLMSLVVVMLLTFFMSEYFFATGLELRGMTTFKDAQQARMLSRSVFKAVQLALLQDEVTFFEGYREVAALLEFSAVPWNNGLLLALQVQPQDHLYNLNNMAGLQPGSVSEICRSEIFRKSAGALLLAREEAGSLPPDTPPPDIDALYAAVFDWLDGDDEVHVEVPGVLGAEAGSYFSLDPEYTIKNAPLDRLTEVRLVRGAQSLLWGEWVASFTALPKTKAGTYCALSERINVNTASAAQIEAFLRAREIAPDSRWSGSELQIQEGINAYAEKAAEVAQAFAPEGEERQSFTEQSLLTTLKGIGVNENYGKNYLLATINQHYRVSIVTEVAGVRARLEAMLHIARDGGSRMAKGTPEVLWVNMN
jgi:type II secretory pathway component PulK